MNNINKYDEPHSMLCGAGATVTIFTIQVPSKSKLTLTDFANYLDLVTHWGHVTWRVLRNGIPVKPYEAVLDNLGLSYQPAQTQRVEFNGGDVLTVIATDDAVVGQPPNLSVGARIKFEME